MRRSAVSSNSTRSSSSSLARLTTRRFRRIFPEFEHEAVQEKITKRVIAFSLYVKSAVQRETLWSAAALLRQLNPRAAPRENKRKLPPPVATETKRPAKSVSPPVPAATDVPSTSGTTEVQPTSDVNQVSKL